MRNDPIYLLEPVFHFLDMMIHDYGDMLYMLLVYASIPLIAWILSGGLRSKQPRRDSAVIIPIIVIRLPIQPPPLPPPPIGRGRDPFSDNDEHSFAA